ncbi:hypothetical protein BASA81_004559 [Batrachochytrium salamandrivorans]|nr:hypothetical protein BASA81_004559 [Batrachochytrium salamandrivorans]
MGEYVPIPKFDDPGFALLQTSKSASMITYRYDHISVVDMMTFALAPPTFGGVMILQLDIRIVFDSLFHQGFVGRVAGVLKSKLGLVSSLLRYTFAYLCQTTYEYSGLLRRYIGRQVALLCKHC